MKRFLALICLFFLNISFSQADVTIDIIESAGDVVATASGTIVSDVSFAGTDTSPGGFVSGNGFDAFENSQLHVGTVIETYKFFADGDNAIFNSAAVSTPADSNTGDHIGLISQKPGFSDIISVDRAYVGLEASVNATSTWNGTTLAALGFIEGTYVFSANGLSTITLNIGNVDITAPTLLSSTPADNATGVSIDPPTLSLVFDEPVSYATGVFRMYRASDDVEINNRSVSGSTGSGTPNISISFENALAINTEYYVLIPAGAFEDAAGNPYAGISSTTELSFSTGAPASPYSIDSAELTVDANNFYFDIVLGGIKPTAAQNGVMRINSEGDDLAAPDTERISINFDTQTGLPLFEPHSASTSGTPLFDRWQDGDLDPVQITANGAGSWRITGFVPHGTQPYVTSDTLRDVQFRAFDDVTINVHMRDIAITAEPTITFSLGGTVSGLTGSGLELQNNGSNTLPVTAAATSFVFATALADGTGYSVTVSTQPTGQTCNVTNGSGVIAAADVTNVSVTCVDDAVPTYSVGGTVSGLTGTGLALQNNGAEMLAVTSDGSFTFVTELLDAATYAVTVSIQPTGQSCTVSNGSGSIATADVTNVTVACINDIVTPPPVPMVPIPAMSEWALILLTMLLGLMVFANRRRLF